MAIGFRSAAISRRRRTAQPIQPRKFPAGKIGPMVSLVYERVKLAQLP